MEDSEEEYKELTEEEVKKLLEKLKNERNEWRQKIKDNPECTWFAWTLYEIEMEIRNLEICF